MGHAYSVSDRGSQNRKLREKREREIEQETEKVRTVAQFLWHRVSQGGFTSPREAQDQPRSNAT